MIVAGVMSGTSADGINVALVNITGSKPQLKLLAHRRYPYPPSVRARILEWMNGSAGVADLARLNVLLGELYAAAVLRILRAARVKKLDLVGCHGQTLYHQAVPATFHGRRIAATWQTGEAAVIAARIGAPVVSDFRPADLAVGGQGAPLVPLLDALLFRLPRIGRIVLNLGGIANLTAIPRGAALGDVIAFDTGPGNMVMDQIASSLFGLSHDTGGRIAARGRILTSVVNDLLRAPYFLRKPPKSAGREQFGREFTAAFIHRCRKSAQFKGNDEDILASAAGLTAQSISQAIHRFVLPLKRCSWELIAFGGGTENPVLMQMLAGELRRLDIALQTSDDLGLPSDAKEAVAFALLAFEAWHRKPSNLPSATGARRRAVLGKISYPPLQP